jgi:hypothetical protein
VALLGVSSMRLLGRCLHYNTYNCRQALAIKTASLHHHSIIAIHSLSPEMNPRELVDHIRSGPKKLVLHEPLRFRRRTRSNPYDFNDFIQALQSSETIRSVTIWCSHEELSITEDEWVRLVNSLGSIKGIQHLGLFCGDGSLNFHPVQALATAVNNARSLRKLDVTALGDPRHVDQLGIVALANALRQHTALQDFTSYDFLSPPAGHQDTSLDPVLGALAACPHLKKVFMSTECASANAIQNLLHSSTVTTLHLELNMEHWLAVADEIQHGRNNIGVLLLSMPEGTSTEATEAVKAIASAIRRDRNLEELELRMQSGFTDEGGVALSEAVTVNTTLRKVTLTNIMDSDDQAQNKATFGAQAYEAFSAMLRVNTSLELKLPPLDTTAGGDQRLLECRRQMRIEQRLNGAGRGELLSSDQTTRAAWVDALHELNATNGNRSRAFQTSCLYSLLRLKPPDWIPQPSDTSNSGL